jgi:hypothetical protein
MTMSVSEAMEALRERERGTQYKLQSCVDCLHAIAELLERMDKRLEAMDERARKLEK